MAADSDKASCNPMLLPAGVKRSQGAAGRLPVFRHVKPHAPLYPARAEQSAHVTQIERPAVPRQHHSPQQGMLGPLEPRISIDQLACVAPGLVENRRIAFEISD